MLDDFRSDITTIDHLDENSVDLNSMTVNFNKYLISLLNKHAPVCRKYMLGETKAPWYNNTILTAKRYKRQLERRQRKLQTDASRQAYRVQCIALNKLLYTSRVNYYSNNITEGGHNTKTLFKRNLPVTTRTQFSHLIMTLIYFLMNLVSTFVRKSRQLETVAQ